MDELEDESQTQGLKGSGQMSMRARAEKAAEALFQQRQTIEAQAVDPRDPGVAHWRWKKLVADLIHREMRLDELEARLVRQVRR